MCARMYVLCGVRHCVIHAEHYTLVCVASCGVGAFMSYIMDPNIMDPNLAYGLEGYVGS